MQCLKLNKIIKKEEKRRDTDKRQIPAPPAASLQISRTWIEARETIKDCNFLLKKQKPNIVSTTTNQNQEIESFLSLSLLLFLPFCVSLFRRVFSREFYSTFFSFVLFSSQPRPKLFYGIILAYSCPMGGRKCPNLIIFKYGRRTMLKLNLGSQTEWT